VNQQGPTDPSTVINSVGARPTEPRRAAGQVDRSGDRGELLARLVRGRSLEFWITIVVAIVVAVLRVLGLVTVEVVLTTLLGMLSLLAYGALGNRRELVELQASLSQISRVLNLDHSDGIPADRFLHRDITEFSQHLPEATEVWLLGVTLSRTLARCGAEIGRRLMAGAHIRMIILDPHGPGLHHAGLRLPTGAENYFEERLEGTIKEVKALKLHYPQGQLDVRMVPGLPPVALYLLNPRTPQGRVYVEIYATEWQRDHPVICLQARRDGAYYFDYVDQFEKLWASACPLWPPACAAVDAMTALPNGRLGSPVEPVE
jgi:hypothetical protein